MDAVFDVVLISDPQGRLAYANRSASQKFGYTRDELLQMQLFELAAPDSHEVLKGILATGSSSSGPSWVSHWLHKDGRVLSLEVKGNLYLSNAVQHSVIVARDLSPTMESGRPETPTPKLLETILHHAPTPVFVNSVEGRYHLVNPAWEQATGKPARDVIGRSSQELFSPDTARFFQQVVRQVAGTGETVAFQEAPMIRGEQKHYHTVSFPIRDHEGKVVAVGGVSLDITDLKLIQAALKEHVAALQALCRHHPESFFLVDDQGKILEASQVAAHRLGLAPDELVGTSAYDYFSPEVSQFRRELINQVMATGQARSFSERREHFWFDTHFIPLKDGTGKATKVMVLAMDITARRLAELALRESEDRFRTIFDNATDGILLAEIETKKFYLSNPMMALMLGYTQEEMQHLGVTDIHPAESLPYALEQFERQASGVCIMGLDMPVVRKDGSIFYADISAFHIRLHGKVYLAGIFRDITKRKQAQEALQTQALVLENMAEAVYVADQMGIIVFANPAAHAMFGYPAGELTGQHFSMLNDLSPEENDRFVGDLIEHLQREGDWAGEIRNRTKGGATFFTSARISTLKLPGKTLWIGVQEDITKRKRAEMELRESEQRFRFMAENIQDAFWIGTAAFDKILYVSPGYERIWGYSAQELLASPRSFMNAIHPEDLEQVQTHLAQVLAQPVSWSHEYRIIRPDGEIRWIHDRGYPVKDKQGRIILFTGVSRDITERRRFENALRQSEAKYRELVENASSIILRVDTHGNITYFNEFAQTFFGYREEEIMAGMWWVPSYRSGIPRDSISPGNCMKYCGIRSATGVARMRIGGATAKGFGWPGPIKPSLTLRGT
jgi:PAS domain S-box-containing protein